MVSFGTEHNTTAKLPLTVSARDHDPLDDRLMEISFKGAAYQAAHQYLAVKEGPQYSSLTRNKMEDLGRAVLNYYFTTTE